MSASTPTVSAVQMTSEPGYRHTHRRWLNSTAEMVPVARRRWRQSAGKAPRARLVVAGEYLPLQRRGNESDQRCPSTEIDLRSSDRLAATVRRVYGCLAVLNIIHMSIFTPYLCNISFIITVCDVSSKSRADAGKKKTNFTQSGPGAAPTIFKCTIRCPMKS